MKELEQEAERYARRFEENELDNYNGESSSIEDRIEMEAFVAGATSKYVEKQKLEFAIEQLNIARTYFDVGKLSAEENTAHIRFTDVLMNKIKELEQKLSEL